MKTLVQRFWEKVEIYPDACWLWTGNTSKGYGRIRSGRRMLRAHRVSWEIANGPIPEGMDALHTCDNPSCVNPAHLFLGTHLDNMRDSVSKGRMHIGENHPSHKLTLSQVRDIISSPLGYRRLASIYGVNRKTIQRIKKGIKWSGALNADSKVCG